MNKTASWFLSLLVALLLTGCHEHVWNDATFIDPKTCARCGETEGEPKDAAYFDLTFLEYMDAFNEQFGGEMSIELIERDGVYINAKGVKFLTLHDDEHADDGTNSIHAVWGLGSEGKFNQLIVRYFVNDDDFDTSFASIFTTICCNYAFKVLDPGMSTKVFYDIASTKAGKDLNDKDYLRATCEHDGFEYQFEWSDYGFGYSTRYCYEFRMTIAAN